MSSSSSSSNPSEKAQISPGTQQVTAQISQNTTIVLDESEEESEKEDSDDDISALAETSISSFDKGALEKKRNVTNPVWKHFNVWSKAPWIAVCLLCQAVQGAMRDAIIKSVKKKCNSVSTSKLTTHMKRHHGAITCSCSYQRYGNRSSGFDSGPESCTYRWRTSASDS